MRRLENQPGKLKLEVLETVELVGPQRQKTTRKGSTARGTSRQDPMRQMLVIQESSDVRASMKMRSMSQMSKHPPMRMRCIED